MRLPTAVMCKPTSKSNARHDRGRVELGTVRPVLAAQVPDAWGHRQLRELPDEMRAAAYRRWCDVANTGPRYAALRHEGGQAPHARANGELWRLVAELRALKYSTVATAGQIEDAARTLAAMCDGALHGRAYSGEKIAADIGLPLEWSDGVTEGGKKRRFCDPRWWRRQLHTHIGRSVEELMRRRALVRRGAAAYVTDWTFRRWAGRRAASRRMIEDSVAVSDEGQQMELSELVDASVSNPANRRREMMLRARGFEELATAAGHGWLFFTLTTPSMYHPQRAHGGGNERYLGASVRDAQDWLNARWQRARAALHRRGVLLYGFRVAEPHHDGTPHWHMLAFTDAPEELERVLRDEWMSEFGSEPGADRHRVVVVRPDGRKGTAAGYIAKYIGKGIDGTAVDVDDESGLDGADGALRVACWASVHGIRQFQQIGGPAVGLWRELRRLREPVESERIEAARRQVDKPASWSRFVDAVGGIAAGRRTVVSVWRQIPLQLGRYGDPRPAQPVGVVSGSDCVRTRSTGWRIVRRDCVAAACAARASSSLGPVSITVRRGDAATGGMGGESVGWRATAWAH